MVVATDATMMSRRRSHRSVLLAGIVFVDLFIAGLVAVVIDQNRQRAVAEATFIGDNYARTIEENFLGFIRRIDVTLLTVADEVARQKAGGGIRRQELEAFLARQDQRIPEARGLRVTDEEGTIRYAVNGVTTPNAFIGDRPYFVRARDDPAAGLVFSDPVMGRSSNVPVVTLSRRISNPDGSFAGEVNAAIAVDRFTGMLSLLDLGADGSASLWNQSQLIARYTRKEAPAVRVGMPVSSPEMRALIDSHAKAGRFHIVTRLDDVERIFQFRRIDDFPLFLVIGLADGDYLAEWRRNSLRLGGLTAVFLLGTALFGWAGWRGLRRREQAEAALRIEETKYHSLFESANDGIFLQDAAGFVDCNERGAQMYGLAREEVIGHSPADLSPERQPDGRLSSDAAMERIRAALDGRPQFFEWQSRRGDGTLFDVEITLNHLDLDGKRYLQSIVRDITERKQAAMLLRETKERLEAAASAGIVGIWDWDIVGDRLVWDKVMYRLYGVREEDFAGAYDAWAKALHPDDRAYAEGELQAALRGEREYAPEFRVIWPDGSVHHLKAVSRTTRDERGAPVRMVGVNYDVTEQKNVENMLARRVTERTRDLESARDVAESANRAKSAFLANMSHELRTPLNAILGFAQLLERDDGIPEDQRQQIGIIYRSGRRLLSLINDVLEVSSIEAGRTTVRGDPFDLSAALTAIEETIRVRAEAKGLEFTVDQPADLPRHVLGDADHLRHVLVNLLDNAVRFTDRGRITLRVAAEADGRVRFEVADTGPGIAEPEQARIFESFYQTTGGIATGEGTGLGLSISRTFVRLMGGEITLASEIGKGSTFAFSIPLPQSEIVPPVAGGPVVVGLADGQAAPRVLVAEDHPDNQEVMDRLLRQLGCEVRIAGNGQEAVDICAAWHPQLILMDIRMPVVNGYEATRAIRNLAGGDSIAIVALTASTSAEEWRNAVAIGCDDLLGKPVDETVLFETIGRLLGLRLRYAQPAPAPAGPPATSLAALPPAVRAELVRGAVALDRELTLAIAGRLGPEHAAEASLVAGLANDYRFDRIEELCR